jgi:hypothetical protein
MNDPKFSLFNEIEKKLQEQKSKTSEATIEAKMSERNQKFNKKSTIEDFREDKQSEEINLRKVTREDKFEQYRRQQQLIIDNSLSLKNIIKLPMNIYEEANKLEINVTNFLN